MSPVGAWTVALLWTLRDHIAPWVTGLKGRLQRVASEGAHPLGFTLKHRVCS